MLTAKRSLEPQPEPHGALCSSSVAHCGFELIMGGKEKKKIDEYENEQWAFHFYSSLMMTDVELI